ncbi:hypothetical protein OF83DRAFT_1095296 [Amylostereum chailletii]|nr:hypothetical protein OF83DRAFT_1095296 [Amylostereum chailletii]
MQASQSSPPSRIRRNDRNLVNDAFPTAFSHKPTLKNNVEAVHTVNIVTPKKGSAKHVAALKSDKGHDKPTAAAAGKGQNHAAAKNNALEDHPAPEVSAIPDPVPDTGDHRAVSDSPEALHSSPIIRLPPVTMTASPSILSTPSVPNTFNVPIVSATSLVSYSPSSQTMSAMSASSPLPRLGNVGDSHGHLESSHSMSVLTITLVAVGSACGLLALIIILRRCSRPRRRVHPTPSLPILQEDSPMYHDKGGDESPLFGGEDRSSRVDSNAPWKWTQYQSGIPKPPPTANINASMATTNGSRHDLRKQPSRLAPTEVSSSMPSTTDAQIQFAQTATYAQPMMVVENSGLRHKSRLSTMTMSAYTAVNHASPVLQEPIGLAVTSGAMAYIASPPLAMTGSESDSAGFTGGRVRVKAPYGAGSYLRTSTSGQRQVSTATSVNPFETDYSVPPLPPMPTDNGSAGDVRALTSVLGLLTSSPPSPGTTSLYPDDSLSIAGGRQPRKQTGGGKRGSTRDPSAALGHLMLSDYGGSMLSPEMGGERGGGRVRADDMPPRVPSPPLLPSLAQMALAHGHEEEYADYRSPTYSIYGLYDPDRKSRIEG